MRVRFAAAVFLTAFLSWLATFAFECYYHGLGSPLQRHPRDDQPPFPGGGAEEENIFWVLQISDIHISKYDNMKIVKDLTTFCSETVSVINPALVLVTGDLTHSKYPNERHSKQFEEEWKAYADVLAKTGVSKRMPWLDIRGNHDNFDVASDFDSTNRFLQYSSSWEHHGSLSYRYIHQTPFGSYSFLALDACPSPGPRRPFNFFGVIHDDDIIALRSLAAAAVHDNQSLWFSHYPSATITGDHRWLRELMRHSVAHVCGHLHTFGNFIYRMYGIHPSGHLELELVDFKFMKRYRLLAFDHDVLSFTDVTLNEWPLVLVTNPKDAHFMVPSREPVGRMRHSTHVHVLAFSPSGITSVHVWVDGSALPPATPIKNGPLYTTPWDAARFSVGLHTITVSVSDSSGRWQNISQRFSLDGTVPSLQLLPELLVLTDFRSLFQMEFFFAWLFLLASLLLAWTNNDKCQPSHFQPLVRTRAIFYPLITYIIYFGIGPWYVGEVLTDVYGLVSVHGVRVAGHFLPGSVTYIHGIIQVVLFQFPLTCYLNHLLSRNHSNLGCSSIIYSTLFSFLLLLQCGWAFSCNTYGAVAVLINPGISWSIPLSFFLVYRAFRTRPRAS